MVTEADYKEATEARDRILKGNKDRLLQIKKEKQELLKKLRARQIDPRVFRRELLTRRNEASEIKRRNFALVQEWIKVDNEFHDGYKAQTLDEALESQMPEEEHGT